MGGWERKSRRECASLQHLDSDELSAGGLAVVLSSGPSRFTLYS
jgi:hypothetical protein